MLNVIQSNDPEIDTLKCPKCKAIWRAKGQYDYDAGGWNYELGDDLCPCGCINFLGFRVTGKRVQ